LRAKSTSGVRDYNVTQYLDLDPIYKSPFDANARTRPPSRELTVNMRLWAYNR